MKIVLASGSPRRRELLAGLGLDYRVVVSGVEECVTETEPAKVVEQLSAQKACDVLQKLRPEASGESAAAGGEKASRESTTGSVEEASRKNTVAGAEEAFRKSTSVGAEEASGAEKASGEHSGVQADASRKAQGAEMFGIQKETRRTGQNYSCSQEESCSEEEILVIGADTLVSVDGQILGKPADAKNAAEMLRRLSGKRHQVYTGVTLYHHSRGRTRRHTFHECTQVQFYPVTEEEISWYISTGEPMDKAGGYGIQGLGSRFVKAIEGDYSNVVGLPVARLYQELKTMGITGNISR